jgi:phosphatidylglycerol:prolipoprotein diacylglycerol transferase
MGLHPELFRIGPFTAYTYGALQSLAILVGLRLTSRQAPREGLDRERTVDLTLLLVIGAFIGARALFVLLNWSFFAGQPLAILGLSDEGLVGLSVFGALLGGVVAAYLVCRRHRLSFAAVADLYARPVALGIGIGRIGCFLNGCCYGKLTNAGWGFYTRYDFGLRHPSQLYETGLCLLLFLALTWYMMRPRSPGQLFLAFLAGYGVVRIVTELFREGEPVAGPLTQAQVASVAMVAVSVISWAALRRRSGDRFS